MVLVRSRSRMAIVSSAWTVWVLAFLSVRGLKMLVLSSELQNQLEGLPPSQRAMVEETAVRTALEIMGHQAIGDGRFLELLIKLLELLIPILIPILTGGAKS